MLAHLNIQKLNLSWDHYCNTMSMHVYEKHSDFIKERPAFIITMIIVMFFITPVIQSINTSLAFEIWFRDLSQKPIIAIMYGTFSILVGYSFRYTRTLETNVQIVKSEHGRIGLLALYWDLYSEFVLHAFRLLAFYCLLVYF